MSHRASYKVTTHDFELTGASRPHYAMPGYFEDAVETATQNKQEP